jgi:hypothetical protein
MCSMASMKFDDEIRQAERDFKSAQVALHVRPHDSGFRAHYHNTIATLEAVYRVAKAAKGIRA